jgi:effector-binding domain-containing protein
MRNRLWYLTVVLLACFSTPVHADGDFDLKSVSTQRVLTVKVGSFAEFPAAFEKLAEYVDAEADLRAIQTMSLGSSRDDLYAAMAFEGSPHETQEVKILELPSATVAALVHRGPYTRLSVSVKKLVEAVRDAGYAPQEKAMLRLLHRNTPEDTAPADLQTEIQIPVIKR